MIESGDEDVDRFRRDRIYDLRDLIRISDRRRVETIGSGFGVRGESVDCGMQPVGITDQLGFATAG